MELLMDFFFTKKKKNKFKGELQEQLIYKTLF